VVDANATGALWRPFEGLKASSAGAVSALASRSDGGGALVDACTGSMVDWWLATCWVALEENSSG
jgi:hypothetical protein